MSRDLTPRECFYMNKQFPGLFFQNIEYHLNDGTVFNIYTEEELADRRAHEYINVLAVDIYGKLKKILDKDKFEKLNDLFKELTEADLKGSDMSVFPKEITDWYFNKPREHYREPLDEMFLEYIEKEWRQQL